MENNGKDEGKELFSVGDDRMSDNVPKRSKLRDERMIDSICTNDEKLDLMLTEIAKRIKEERIRQNMSVKELADLSGVTVSVIYRIENNTCPIGLKSLLKLMWALSRPIERFIPFEEHVRVSSMGEKFDELTAPLDRKQTNCLLDIISMLVKFKEIESIEKKQIPVSEHDIDYMIRSTTNLTKKDK